MVVDTEAGDTSCCSFFDREYSWHGCSSGNFSLPWSYGGFSISTRLITYGNDYYYFFPIRNQNMKAYTKAIQKQSRKTKQPPHPITRRGSNQKNHTKLMTTKKRINNHSREWVKLNHISKVISKVFLYHSTPRKIIHSLLLFAILENIPSVSHT